MLHRTRAAASRASKPKYIEHINKACNKTAQQQNVGGQKLRTAIKFAGIRVNVLVLFPAGPRHAVREMEIINAQVLSAETIASQENSMNFLHLLVPLKQNMKIHLTPTLSLCSSFSFSLKWFLLSCYHLRDLLSFNISSRSP